MRVSDPVDMPAVFGSLFNGGDAEGLAALFEAGALFVDPEGREHRGVAAIRSVLAAFLGTGMRIALEGVHCHVAGDLALARVRWTLTPPGAAEPAISGVSSELLRRQPDGGWRFAIDLPAGGA